MIEVIGDIFELAFSGNYDMLLVTTNGCVDRFGRNVMGAGFAKAIKELVPETAQTLGTFLQRQRERLKDVPRADVIEPWNIPYRIGSWKGVHLFSFPTKPTTVTVTENSLLPKYFPKFRTGQRVEGWMGFSQISLIERSAEFIANLVSTSLVIERVILPRAGTENGGLPWLDVKEVLDKYFDERYTVVELDKGQRRV